MTNIGKIHCYNFTCDDLNPCCAVKFPYTYQLHLNSIYTHFKHTHTKIFTLNVVLFMHQQQHYLICLKKISLQVKIYAIKARTNGMAYFKFCKKNYYIVKYSKTHKQQQQQRKKKKCDANLAILSALCYSQYMVCLTHIKPSEDMYESIIGRNRFDLSAHS